MQGQNVQRDAQDTALKMIRLHGLRAQAVALERAAELRQQHDPAGHDRWQQIHAAICELAPYGTPPGCARLSGDNDDPRPLAGRGMGRAIAAFAAR